VGVETSKGAAIAVVFEGCCLFSACFAALLVSGTSVLRQGVPVLQDRRIVSSESLDKTSIPFRQRSVQNGNVRRSTTQLTSAIILAVISGINAGTFAEADARYDGRLVLVGCIGS